MDSWSEKQLRAMTVGGNARLADFLRQRGVDKLPIVQKYNTAAAAMYRDIIIALRDGKLPPTDIAPYEAEIAEDERRRGTGGSSTPSSGGDTESPIDRDARLKSDAQERMRAKFGPGGLKGHSSNNTGFGSSSASGSSAGSAAPEDIFGVDLAAANQRLSALAGSAFTRLSQVRRSELRAAVACVLHVKMRISGRIKCAMHHAS